jgi:hypothetical protein
MNLILILSLGAEVGLFNIYVRLKFDQSHSNQTLLTLSHPKLELSMSFCSTYRTLYIESMTALFMTFRKLLAKNVYEIDPKPFLPTLPSLT